jgi:hypothetical protein
MIHYIIYQLALLRLTVQGACHEQMKYQNKKKKHVTVSLHALYN